MYTKALGHFRSFMPGEQGSPDAAETAQKLSRRLFQRCSSTCFCLRISRPNGALLPSVEAARRLGGGLQRLRHPKRRRLGSRGGPRMRGVARDMAIAGGERGGLVLSARQRGGPKRLGRQPRKRSDTRSKIMSWACCFGASTNRVEHSE